MITKGPLDIYSSNNDTVLFINCLFYMLLEWINKKFNVSWPRRTTEKEKSRCNMSNTVHLLIVPWCTWWRCLTHLYRMKYISDLCCIVMSPTWHPFNQIKPHDSVQLWPYPNRGFNRRNPNENFLMILKSELLSRILIPRVMVNWNKILVHFVFVGEIKACVTLLLLPH